MRLRPPAASARPSTDLGICRCSRRASGRPPRARPVLAAQAEPRARLSLQVSPALERLEFSPHRDWPELRRESEPPDKTFPASWALFGLGEQSSTAIKFRNPSPARRTKALVLEF